MNIKEMYAQQGIYVIVTVSGVQFVEIDEDHNCHQLKSETFERDGLLVCERWIESHIVAICGPLARPNQ